jgi:hypothetical protein
MRLASLATPHENAKVGKDHEDTSCCDSMYNTSCTELSPRKVFPDVEAPRYSPNFW